MLIPIFSVKLHQEKLSTFFQHRTVYDGTAKSILPLLRYIMSGVAQEIKVVLILDSSYRVTGVVIVGMGSLTAVHTSTEQIFGAVIAGNGAYVVTAHNHPSGSIEPSDNDKRCHDYLKKSGQILGKPLLDNLILGENRSYFSWTEHEASEWRKKMKSQRQKFVAKAIRRVEAGIASPRDRCLIFADKLMEIPGMVRDDSPQHIKDIVEGLKRIAEEPARIRRKSRERAVHLLSVAEQVQRLVCRGEFVSRELLKTVDVWEDVLQKGPDMSVNLEFVMPTKM
jgi:hypothetical protein